MILKYIIPVLMHALLTGATLEVRTGLLHRLVQFYKTSFFSDLLSVAPVKLDVSIKPAPLGYQDPPTWDFDSAVRLLALLRESDSLPARRLYDQLAQLKDRPSRRYMGMGKLHKARQLIKRRMQKCAGDPSKPGYPKHCRKPGKTVGARKFRSRKENGLSRLYVPSFPNPNDMYYDEMISFEDMRVNYSALTYNGTIGDEEILVITNPVEAKLPSGHISIGMLRRILEMRAEAARVMPTKPQPPADTTDGSSGTDVTGVDGGGDNSTNVEEGSETTTGGSEAGTGEPAEGKPDEGNADGQPEEAPAERRGRDYNNVE